MEEQIQRWAVLAGYFCKKLLLFAFSFFLMQKQGLTAWKVSWLPRGCVTLWLDCFLGLGAPGSLETGGQVLVTQTAED